MINFSPAMRRGIFRYMQKVNLQINQQDHLAIAPDEVLFGRFLKKNPSFKIAMSGLASGVVPS